MKQEHPLKDGYYISVYTTISDVGHIYKVPLRHNHNIALWLKTSEKIELVHYWELERLTAIKEHQIPFYNKNHFLNFIGGLLKQHSIGIEDIMEIWGTPFLDTEMDYHSIEQFPQYAYHSICHLYSSLYMDSDLIQSNEPIFAMAMDGSPDNLVDKDAMKKYYFIGAYKKGKNINLFPIASPGPIWYYASRIFGLKEGTLMALANIGNNSDELISKSKYRGLVKKYCDDMEKGIYLTPKFMHMLVKEAEMLVKNKNILLKDFTVEENKISIVMSMVQEMSYWIMDYNIESAINKFKIIFHDTTLMMSGGFGLNCPTNSYLIKKYGFKGFVAPPCINDSGQALGIGLYCFKRKMGNFIFKLKSAFYGDWEDIKVEELWGKYSELIYKIDVFDVEKAVEDLMTEPIVWFEGRSEIGPRALGGRSILADPRKTQTKDLINQIKHRQWWRPVAPIVLEDKIDEYFEDAYPSPYMLHTFKIRSDKIAEIPAVSHLDGSARIQSISYDTDKKYLLSLMQKFYERTGCPIICNTSLNDRGEPIINKYSEALNFAIRKNIRIIYLNGIRVELNKFIKHIPVELGKRSSFTYCSVEDTSKLKSEYNPHGLPDQLIQFYIKFIKFNQNDKDLDIHNLHDIAIIKRLYEINQHSNDMIGF